MKNIKQWEKLGSSNKKRPVKVFFPLKSTQIENFSASIPNLNQVDFYLENSQIVLDLVIGESKRIINFQNVEQLEAFSQELKQNRELFLSTCKDVHSDWISNFKVY